MENLEKLAHNLNNILYKEENLSPLFDLTEAVQSVKDKDFIFEIKSQNDFNYFVEQVNLGRKYLNAILMSDIEITSLENNKDPWDQNYCIIKKEYCGTFDGNNKTLKFNNISFYSTSLFYKLSSAKIKNLKLYSKETVTSVRVEPFFLEAENTEFNNIVNNIKYNTSSSDLYPIEDHIVGALGAVVNNCIFVRCGNNEQLPNLSYGLVQKIRGITRFIECFNRCPMATNKSVLGQIDQNNSEVEIKYCYGVNGTPLIPENNYYKNSTVTIKSSYTKERNLGTIAILEQLDLNYFCLDKNLDYPILKFEKPEETELDRFLDGRCLELKVNGTLPNDNFLLKHNYILNYTDISKTFYHNNFSFGNIIHAHYPNLIDIVTNGNNGDSKIKTISLPKVKNLDNAQTFLKNARNLTTLSAPNLINIPNNFAVNTISLINLNIQSAQNIGEYAFLNSGIYELNNKNIISINRNAFDGCKNLKNIILPNLTSIKVNSFANCSNLEMIKLNNISFSQINSMNWVATSNYSKVSNVYLNITDDANKCKFFNTLFNTGNSNFTINLFITQNVQCVNKQWNWTPIIQSWDSSTGEYQRNYLYDNRNSTLYVPKSQLKNYQSLRNDYPINSIGYYVNNKYIVQWFGKLGAYDDETGEIINGTTN